MKEFTDDFVEPCHVHLAAFILGFDRDLHYEQREWLLNQDIDLSKA
jgi:hypothetical protein